MANNKIKELRLRLGLSLEDVAGRVGTSHQNIQRLESGGVSLTSQWIEPISRALNCYPSELLPDEWQKEHSLYYDALSKAIQLAEEFLNENELEMPPEIKGRFVAAIYEMAITEEKKATEENREPRRIDKTQLRAMMRVVNK
jgi:transcriptional regulator with XRE-family HTH domain